MTPSSRQLRLARQEPEYPELHTERRTGSSCTAWLLRAVSLTSPAKDTAMALRMRVWLAVWGVAQVAFSRPVRAVLALLEPPATVLPAALVRSDEGSWLQQAWHCAARLAPGLHAPGLWMVTTGLPARTGGVLIDAAGWCPVPMGCHAKAADAWQQGRVCTLHVAAVLSQVAEVAAESGLWLSWLTHSSWII